MTDGASWFDRWTLRRAFTRLSVTQLEQVEHLQEKVKQALDSRDDEIEAWSDADKLRIVALHLYNQDWRRFVYDQDMMQTDLIRIADNLEEYERRNL